VDPEGDDDSFDPRWELVNQLLQYRKFKEAAGRIEELAALQRDLLGRHVSVISADRPLLPVGRLDLWTNFNLVLRRLAEKLVVGQIEDEQVTVADKMEELLALTQTRTSFVFSELFAGPLNLRVLVATFLAVLELTRLGRLRLRQDEAFADIVCEAAPVMENPLETPAESDTLTV
jgi:segregation and condensation protein A